MEAMNKYISLSTTGTRLMMHQKMFYRKSNDNTLPATRIDISYHMIINSADIFNDIYRKPLIMEPAF